MKTTAWLVLGGLTISACGTPDDMPMDVREYRFITHADAENPFWLPVIEGMNAAAADRGVTADFYGAVASDVAPEEQQARLIRQAIADGVAGLAITVSDPAVLEAPVQEAAAAGIPVIAFNVGLTDADRELYDLPITTYVGQIETVAAGKAALHGRDLVEQAGGTVDLALCIKGMNEASWAVQRCDGMTAAFAELGIEVQTLGGDFYAQPPSIPRGAIEDWFIAHPEVDFVFSTAPAVLNLILSMQLDGTVAESVVVGSVDLNEETLEAISAGTCAFAVDQQPYLQGFLPIILLELDNEYLLRLGDDAQTGPFFVDTSNVDEIASLIRQDIR